MRYSRNRKCGKLDGLLNLGSICGFFLVYATRLSKLADALVGGNRLFPSVAQKGYNAATRRRIPGGQLGPPCSGKSPDSLVSPLFVDGLLDGPLLSPGVSVLPRSPRRATCEEDNVFRVGEFLAPLGSDATQRPDAVEYMIFVGDFVLGNRSRMGDGQTSMRLCQSCGASYRRWIGRENCMVDCFPKRARSG